MCQVLRGEFLLLEPCGKAGFDFIEGAFERAIGGVMIRKGAGEAWAQEPVVSAGEKQGRAEAGRGDAVAEAVGDFFDNPVKPQAAKLIGQSALGDAGWSAAEAVRDKNPDAEVWLVRVGERAFHRFGYWKRAEA